MSNVDKYFPNGLTSYLETYYEVVDFISLYLSGTNILYGINGSSNKIESLHNSVGHGGLWELAKELTDKFELQYTDEEWIDRDWFETIEDFLKKELYETT
jgi:hypothetical protein